MKRDANISRQLFVAQRLRRVSYLDERASERAAACKIDTCGRLRFSESPSAFSLALFPATRRIALVMWFSVVRQEVNLATKNY